MGPSSGSPWRVGALGPARVVSVWGVGRGRVGVGCGSGPRVASTLTWQSLRPLAGAVGPGVAQGGVWPGQPAGARMGADGGSRALNQRGSVH